MASSVAPSPLRTEPKNLRTDLQSIRAGSQMLRIDAKAEFLTAVKEAKAATGLSNETMAINAGCTESQMSDAINGKDNRNFAGQWVLAQGNEFVAKFNESIERQRGLTTEARTDIEIERICELLGLLLRRMVRAEEIAS